MQKSKKLLETFYFLMVIAWFFIPWLGYFGEPGGPQSVYFTNGSELNNASIPLTALTLLLLLTFFKNNIYVKISFCLIPILYYIYLWVNVYMNSIFYQGDALITLLLMPFTGLVGFVVYLITLKNKAKTEKRG